MAKIFTRSKPVIKFRYLFVLVLVLIEFSLPKLSIGQSAQNQSGFGYSVALQRLQFKLTTSFVYFHMHRKMDMDSVALLVSEGENLPYSLYYDEDFIDGEDGPIKELLEDGSRFLFRSGAEKTDLEHALRLFLSAKSKADKTGSIYWQNAVLAALGHYYIQSNEREKSQRSFTKAIALARKSDDPIILARALINRGTTSGYDDPQKEKDLSEALTLVRQQRDTVREIEVLTRIYEIYFVKTKYDTVKKQLLHVTDLEKLIGYKHIHYNHSVLSHLNYFLTNKANVFAENKTAVTIMEANGDLAFSNFFYINMAHSYMLLDRPDKALEWLEKSLDMEHMNKVKRIWYENFFIVSLNIAVAGHSKKALEIILRTTVEYPPLTGDQKMKVAHALGYCYFSQKQFELCKKQYDVMLSFMQFEPVDMIERDGLHTSYIHLAMYYMAVGQVELSKEYFEKSKPFRNDDLLANKYMAHRMQFQIDSAMGNYLKAIREYQLSTMAFDSMYAISKLNQLQHLQVEYETESKNKDIELLVEKANLQEATLRQSRQTRNITFAGIAVMMLITGLVYGQYRNKQKRNAEMNQKNLMLEQLVKEKDWLVKEIHHRVKNNFHTVTGLLDIQASYLKNKEALSAIKESQNRIHSMSIIHQKLYQSDSLSTIHMPEYIYELVEYLKESFSIRQTIRFDVHVGKITLNHAVAITLGLILNEAITNAIKYAFINPMINGKISISLDYISNSQILLSIADNGPGLPKDFDSHLGATMGMELLQGLAGDIGGTFSIESDPGTHIKIIFNHTPEGVLA